MVFNQISQPRQRVSLRIAFSELDALSGSKTSGCTTSPHLRFSNHGRSGGSQTTPPMARALGPVQRPWQIKRFSNKAVMSTTVYPFSNHVRSSGSQTRKRRYGPRDSSATMADRAILKHYSHYYGKLIWFSNHGRSGDSQTGNKRPLPWGKFSNHGRSGDSQTCGCGYAV